MPFQVLACPQCGAPLPRQARWRMVDCPNCGSRVTWRESVVEAAAFREALRRSHPPVDPVRDLTGPGGRVRLQTPLGRGARSEIHLALRLGPVPSRVLVKIARDGLAPGDLAREADLLVRIRAAGGADPDFLDLRLPLPVAVGISTGPVASGREVLLLRPSVGVWGSGADLLHLHPDGIDPRHMVWIWRRILELLAPLHRRHWVHGDIAPEHLLLLPEDHGCLLAGWACATPEIPGTSLRHPTPVRDLAQVAWCMRALVCGAREPDQLPGGVPAPLRALLDQCVSDTAWLAALGAAGLDGEVQRASREAFGPPVFLPFIPGAPASGRTL